MPNSLRCHQAFIAENEADHIREVLLLKKRRVLRSKETILELQFQNQESMRLEFYCPRPLRSHYGRDMGWSPNLALSEDALLAPERDETPGDTESQSSLVRVRGWLKSCVSNHGLCASQGKGKSPPRLLDISGGAVRLIEAPGAAERYVCLSHRWSSPQQT